MQTKTTRRKLWLAVFVSHYGRETFEARAKDADEFMSNLPERVTDGIRYIQQKYNHENISYTIFK